METDIEDQQLEQQRVVKRAIGKDGSTPVPTMTEPVFDKAEEVFLVSVEWTDGDYERLLTAIGMYGYDNTNAITAYMGSTHNATQVRTFMQKYMLYCAQEARQKALLEQDLAAKNELVDLLAKENNRLLRKQQQLQRAEKKHQADTATTTTTTTKVTKERSPRFWSNEEHAKFLEALEKYGNDVKAIAAHVGTRTAIQVRTHAQKYFETQAIAAGELPAPIRQRKRKSPSIFTTTISTTTEESFAAGVVASEGQQFSTTTPMTPAAVATPDTSLVPMPIFCSPEEAVILFEAVKQYEQETNRDTVLLLIHKHHLPYRSVDEISHMIDVAFATTGAL
jgi:SHAQKYF class myb-like DNA-binding protein